MKLVMMGTGPFAVPTFVALLKSEHEVQALITRPDKVARGRKQAPPNPMREVAEEASLPVHAPTDINDEEAHRLLDELRADLFVVCDYGQILSAATLEKSRLGGINLHGSLLPKYRGAAPVNWALLEGDTVAGITVILMTPRLDGGPMLCQRSLAVEETDDAETLEGRLSELGVGAVQEAIAQLADWDGVQPLGTRQDPALVTKAPRLRKGDGAVDWSCPAVTIARRVRGLKPWPGSFTNLVRPGKAPLRVILQSVRCGDASPPSAMQPGAAWADDDGTIHVQCGAGVLVIDRLKPAGKREMDGQEFVRGYGSSLLFGTEEKGAS